GRAGDILGRRRMFRAGILAFSLASLLGGLATTSWLLITARVLQGVGAAVAAPAALSLITVTFPEGKRRARALGVYAAMTGMGGLGRGGGRVRRRIAPHLRRRAVVVLHQRPHRPAPPPRPPAFPAGTAAFPPPLGPARCGHRHGGLRPAHLRPDPRGDRAGWH